MLEFLAELGLEVVLEAVVHLFSNASEKRR